MPFVKAARDLAEKRGEDITYTPEAGEAVTIRAIFESSYEEVDQDLGVVVQSTQPRLSCVILSDIPTGGASGDRLTVRGVTYRMRDMPHADEDGICDLYLHKV
jgi:hypothetical protein